MGNDTKEKSTAAEYIQALKSSSTYGSQVVGFQASQQVGENFYKGSLEIHEELSKCLKLSGIKELYTHQGAALQHIRNGSNVVSCTPTSSGKSLIYNLPVLDKLTHEPSSKALYIFPLKALSQDQNKAIINLVSKSSFFADSFPLGVSAIYDGDTSVYKRRKIRELTPPILITNPEMIHLSLLPYHESWAHFLKHLRFVIIDELHTYRGIFGSHFSWVIRRLKRVAAYYGAKPQFILSSATIGNPSQFASDIIGEPVAVVEKSGAPQSKKYSLLLNPWDGAAYTASKLLEASMKRGLRTIVYTQSRKMTELISVWTLPKLGSISSKLSSYRAGFLPEERREIEIRMNNGELTGVISTSALELGIDIGDLDICILVGYPGSIMASKQRGGRVGRAGRESAVILIASDDALDQYYMKNPDRFFSSEVEKAVINPYNGKIMEDHIHCAAAEIPLKMDEEELADTRIHNTLADLIANCVLLEGASDERIYARRKRPQRYINLRGAGDSLSIIDGGTGEIIGEIDSSRALKECHDKAIYLHKMKTYCIKRLDLIGKEVIAQAQEPSFYTRVMTTKDTEILEHYRNRAIYGCTLNYGKLRVAEQVTGFQIRNKGTNKLVSTEKLDLPCQTIETMGIWLEIPQQLISELEGLQLHFMGGLHALEHLLISVFPLLILCDRNDIGGISCPHHEQINGSAVFIYDGHPGGSGLSSEAYELAERLILTGKTIISECDCENGCPRCIHSPKCGSGNRPIDKKACLHLMHAIVTSLPPKQSNQKCSTVIINENAIQSMHEKIQGASFLPEKWGVYDVETKFSADRVGGWSKPEKMGMSVAVVYDSTIDRYIPFLEHEVEKLFEHLKNLDLIVGFNNKRFDNRVLSAYGSHSLETIPTIDILEEIHTYLGYRLKLDSLAKHTLGTQKTGDGKLALQWYREQKFDLLIEYCKKDVGITKSLFLYALEKNFLLFQNKARKKVKLPLPLAKKIRDVLKCTI